MFDCSIDGNVLVKDLTDIFNQQAGLPGIILVSHTNFLGLLSRDRCFEAIGRPFGIEIYSKKKAFDFFKQVGVPPLILDEGDSVQDAVRSALGREGREVYAPIVVRLAGGSYRILDMHTLLTAQNELLEKLYLDVQHLSLLDPLTNIYNRRGFFEAAHHHVSNKPDHQVNLSAVMLDIDYFKMVNDVYGHSVGDFVLRTIAEEIQKSLRTTDLLGRFGGEEFILLLPNTTSDLACLVADRVRERIENLVVYYEGFQISVTLSAGVSYLDTYTGTLDTLLTRADEAMYVAKWSGRNQTVLWDRSLAHQSRKDPLPSNPQKNPRTDFINRSGMDASRVYDETIEGWAHALELRDKETEGHAQRVTGLAMELSRRMGISGKELVDVRRGALLHDIGKIAIPDGILFKPGPLTDEEWEIMRKHPVYAFELLSPITYLQSAIEIPYCHHERWDGSGYPRGIKGGEIPLSARIFSIIDVWDALTTDRCYRSAWSQERAIEYIRSESGKMFDPQIVPEFFEMMQKDALAGPEPVVFLQTSPSK